MFCISCGKKISKISKFCKYCGAKQIIKKKLNKKEYETIWACDYCGKEFKTKDESDEHELACKKNQTKQNLFWIFIVFLGIYFLTYFISNSYAQNNGLPIRDLLQPQKWFSSEGKKGITPTPTILPIPTIKITPTSKPKTQNTTNTGNTGSQIDCIGPDGKQFKTTMTDCKALNEKWGKPVDYIVSCTVHQDCGGGSRRLKLSECNNSTCCQIGSGWSFYLSREKCKQDQSNLNKGSSNNNSPPSNNTNSQNTSPKVMFNATETSIKGTYYCYENKVNEMVTQQSLVKGERELYEVCKSSSYNQNIFNQCWKDTCSGLPDTSACSSTCYDKAYGECSNYYKTYLEYRSKLDSMRWDNCP